MMTTIRQKRGQGKGKKAQYRVRLKDDLDYEESKKGESRLKGREQKAQHRARLKDGLDYDENKKTETRSKGREQKVRYRAKKRDVTVYDDDKKAEDRSKERTRKARYRRKENYANITNDTSIPTIPNIRDTVDTDAPLKIAVEALSRTTTNMYDSETEEKLHSTLVYIVCDEFIIGMEPHFWISTKTILKHKDRLS
eukprot:6787450-Ditylum_brightwellii.AAC.1